MGIVHKFQDTAAAIGIGNASLYAVARASSALTGGRVRIVKYYFTAQPVVASAPAVVVRTGKFTLDWLKQGSPLFAQVERPAAVIEARFAQGSRCLAATIEGGELAGFLWYVVGPYVEDEVRARFVPVPSGQTAWDFDVLVQPKYRMGRLFSYLWTRGMTEMAQAGVQKTISRISAFNGASIASHRRLGARIVGKATFLCVGNWQLMKSSMAPGWHFSSHDGKVPELKISA
jgi:hypothetical protein